MYIVRYLPILISLLVSIGLCMLGAALMPAENGAYGALICGEDIPDHEIRERLEARGFTGVVSESGQWVLLDNFGDIERVSLDEYTARLLPSDPRNDGYAEKLRSLFVRDNLRFIYIPLGSAGTGMVGIEKRLAAALGDIPFSFHAGAPQPLGLFIVLFCLAAAAFLAIPPLRLTLRPHAACLFPLLPALAPLALGGAAGFAMASLLAGCAAILAGPWLEWRLTLPGKQPAHARQAPALCRLLPPMFLIFYGAIAFFSGLHLLFILPVTVFFFALMVFQLRRAYLDASGGDGKQPDARRRFAPVSIFIRRAYTFAFSWAMLPFAIVALALACAGYFVAPAQAALPAALPSADAVTEADYHRHYLYQSFFSFRSLHAPDYDMGVYELAPNGLLGKTGRAADTEITPDGIPPFPLDDLIQYLSASGHGGNVLYALLAALMPLLFVFPILFRRKPDALLLNQAYWSTLLKRLA